MEIILVASDDIRDSSIRAILDGALYGILDNTLVEALGNVTSDRIGMELASTTGSASPPGFG